ncbi:pilin [Vibrio sp. SCSIO 43136]|uniref:pilin n=1 Tax=Vibrio sp. SCSIO 43136 TaxID=2819101 RepID=UPI00207531B1|nr:pilin [Vibrio sp. SCSIO 43136]USD64853.1 pilin [Vibrio sp. SCSIO 43136]
MKKQQGFTLIELMIVVAVIGVLAMVAVPQYQKYVGKSEAASALASITGLRTNVETYVIDNGAFPANSAAVAIPTITGATISFQSISGAGGTIQYLFSSSGNSANVNGKKVNLIRTGDGNWSCSSDINDTDIEPKGCS